MTVNIEYKLNNILKNSSFSVRLDEFPVEDNNALLMAYVRYLEKNNILQEKMLFTLNITTNAAELSIFTTVNSYFAKYNIHVSNIVVCTTDKTPSMIGRYRKLIVFLC
jgi:hypothetical protein